MGYTREDILAQLDACAAQFVFPMLDNGYVFPVDSRLRAFRDSGRWALAIECLGYSPRAGRLQNCIHLFGNCLKRSPGTANEDFLCPVEGDIEDPENPGCLRSDVDALLIRGHEIPLPSTTEPRQLIDVFRDLVPDHRDLLLATEDEIRDRLPPDLPQVLQLETWNHPDLSGDEKPSQSECFLQLADLMASGDVSRYRPTRDPNTHWSNWPDGGAL